MPQLLAPILDPQWVVDRIKNDQTGAGTAAKVFKIVDFAVYTDYVDEYIAQAPVVSLYPWDGFEVSDTEMNVLRSQETQNIHLSIICALEDYVVTHKEIRRLLYGWVPDSPSLTEEERAQFFPMTKNAILQPKQLSKHFAFHTIWQSTVAIDYDPHAA